MHHPSSRLSTSPGSASTAPCVAAAVQTEGRPEARVVPRSPRSQHEEAESSSSGPWHTPAAAQLGTGRCSTTAQDITGAQSNDTGTQSNDEPDRPNSLPGEAAAGRSSSSSECCVQEVCPEGVGHLVWTHHSESKSAGSSCGSSQPQEVIDVGDGSSNRVPSAAIACVTFESSDSGNGHSAGADAEATCVGQESSSNAYGSRDTYTEQESGSWQCSGYQYAELCSLWVYQGNPPISTDVATLPPIGVPSLGSLCHGFGTCRRCHFYFSHAGCSNGRFCSFCHFPHPGKKRGTHRQQVDVRCASETWDATVGGA